METPFNVYSTQHMHSVAVCEAIRTGTGFPVVPPTGLLDGGVAMYGFLRGLLPILKEAQAIRRPWVYADRGYFRVTSGTDYSGFFRVSRNAYQFHGRGLADPVRWQKLLIRLAPWRRGRHVLVCPPGDIFTQAIGGFSAKAWLNQITGVLQCATDRPIRIRHKPKLGDASVPLAQDLQDCHALVTYMSNTAVEALVAGVPVFCTGSSSAQCMGRADIKQIETPYYPDDRERWAAALANNQWTLDEIRRGMANEVFK